MFARCDGPRIGAMKAISNTRSFPGTDLPSGLMLVLVGVGLPRTILADLDLVTQNGSLLYYVLALVPFACWFAAALLRESRRPIRDFLVLGTLYGLSLVVVHQVLWYAPGHHLPASAFDFADSFPQAWHEVALRVYSGGVAMMIGIGTGLVVAAVAWCASSVRARMRSRDRGWGVTP